MPKEETIELRHIRNTIGERNDLPSLNPEASLTSRLRALVTKFFGVPQLIHLYGALGLNKTITFAAGEDNVVALFSDGEYLYAGLITTPGKIIKIDLATFTAISTLTLPITQNRVYAFFSDGTYLYAGLDIANSSIIKIDLRTFTITSTLPLGAINNIQSLFSDGTFLYAGAQMSPNGKIVKIDLESFTIDSTLTVSDKNIKSLFSDGNYLYAGLLTSPGKVIKVDLSTFTEIGVLTLAAGLNRISIIFSDGIYLYAGLDMIASSVVKINLSSFTVESSILISQDYIASMFSDGTYLYVGTWTTPGNLIKIDLATFTIANTLVFDAGNNKIFALFSDGVYLYSGLEIAPGRVVRTYIIPSADLYQRKIDLIQKNALTQANIISDATPFAGADIGTIKTTTNTINQRIVTEVSVMEFWSQISTLITLTTATADINLPDVVIAGIPANTTIVRVIGLYKCRSFNDTSTALNAINGASTIDVKKSTGAWGVDNILCIDIATGAWSTKASAKETGMTIEGTYDVKAKVDGNATYNLRFDGNIFVTGNNLELIDVMTGLRVYFIAT